MACGVGLSNCWPIRMSMSPGWRVLTRRSAQIDAKTAERLETEAKYAVYLDRQRPMSQQIRHEESRLIPAISTSATCPAFPTS